MTDNTVHNLRQIIEGLQKKIERQIKYIAWLENNLKTTKAEVRQLRSQHTTYITTEQWLEKNPDAELEASNSMTVADRVMYNHHTKKRAYPTRAEAQRHRSGSLVTYECQFVRDPIHFHNGHK